jgi:hypothetical protein
VDSLLTLLLVVIGLLLLLLSLAGVAFGVFMALDDRTREQGVFFAIWWVPAVAASLGVMLRDRVTFAIGALCFVIAGAVLALEHHSSKGQVRSKRRSTGTSSRLPPEKGSSDEGVKRRLLERIKQYRKTTSS